MSEHHTKSERYVVVRSQSGRLSCWPEERALPESWARTAVAGTREQCLEAIEKQFSTRSDDEGRERHLQMSLMFFGDSETDRFGEKFRLLLESARFADRNGFAALWLPERHFTKFGCLFPSPAVVQAAVASETDRLSLRAGSVVMPLNDPVRVTEEWAVVDNLSNGRVELAFASGWHPDDFALHPNNYERRTDAMYEGIRDVRRLWGGQTLERANGAGEKISVRTYPTPVQKELPVWLTAAGNPATFQRAGELGFGVLTHLFHQEIAELESKLQLYRQSREAAGFDPAAGRVAVTLHAYVADSLDEVRQEAGEAYCSYLRSNLGLLKQLAFSQGQSMDVESLPRAELDQMLHWMVDKFIGGRSLMGTIETCKATCCELANIGVTEVVCLLDFGPQSDDILQRNLPALAKLRAELASVQVR